MPIEVTMPRLSDTMEEGTLIKWRVQPGDAVKSGDILADIETDKATMELQAFDDGTVAKLVAEEGQTLPVGGLILVLAEEGEDAQTAVASATEPAAEKKQPAKTAEKTATPTDRPSPRPSPPPEGEGARQRVSPLARKIAEERGVDLTKIRGSGPDGRIIKRDVIGVSPTETVAAKPPATAQPQAAGALPGTGKTLPLSSMRKTIARRLVESKTTIPHFTVTVRVEMDLLLGPRGAKKQLESQGIKLSVNDFVVRAAVIALQKLPGVNASWSDAGIVQHADVNVGIAVALPPEKGGGLVVPVLHKAQDLGLRQINALTKKLADKARTTGLTADEMAGGTFTISNLGMFGVDHFEAIINPPQAAILAVGAALDQPIVHEGQIIIGKVMTCTLSADHRVIDGAMAAEFLQTLRQTLENPAVLLV